MLKKQAPGETILKVGGMLLLFLGVLLAFGSGNTLSLVMKGSSDSAVVEYLKQNGMTYSQLVASNVMVLVAGVIYLAAGVVGVKQAGKVENAGLCVGMGGLLIAEVVAEVIVTMIFGDFDPASVIRMLMFPAIYMIGAVPVSYTHLSHTVKRVIDDYIACLQTRDERYSDLAYAAGIRDTISLLQGMGMLNGTAAISGNM